MIHFEHVTKLYKTVIGVNDINLDLSGGVYGLLGPNGSGKTTLINLIIGQLRPTIGQIKVFGSNPWSNDALLRRVGLCPAADVLYPSVCALDWVTYLCELHGIKTAEAKERAEHALELVDMTYAMKRPMGGYSLGMRQRSKLAQAIAHEPDLLILDEPFNGLDPIGRHKMTEVIRDWISEGRSIILASHILYEVESIKPSFLLISGGRVLASGSPREVRELITDVPNEIYFRVSDRGFLARSIADKGLFDAIRFDKHQHDGVIIQSRRPLDLLQAIQHLVEQDGFHILEIRAEEDSLKQLFATLMKIHRGEI
jgi:ABC-2 type transport system ATP-binding protein